MTTASDPVHWDAVPGWRADPEDIADDVQYTDPEDTADDAPPLIS